MRELILNWGFAAASSNSLTRLLTQSNDPNHESNRDGYTSNAPVLLVGGAQEAFYAIPDTYTFVLNSRKGFIRIALKTGAPLVPCIAFGENNLFEQIQFPEDSIVRKIQLLIKKYTKLAPVLLQGRGFLQYNYGFIPRRHPLVTVVGKPLYVEKNPNPTKDEIDEVHALFCKQVIELFEANKGKYVKNSENVHVNIIWHSSCARCVFL